MTSLQVSRQDAAAELLARREARSSLLKFTEYTYHSYTADPVHALIASTLDKVVEGKIKRLMIFASPQHGKSELASIRLPAYWLGRRPDDPVIIASYGADLARSKSRQARDIVESPEYGSLFGSRRTTELDPIAIRSDSRAVHQWSLAPPYRGGVRAVGVGGGLTGHPGMLGIIDDPVADYEQAKSEVYRERAWQWYRTTFYTRIWEDGAIVLIMTRWHADDLAGRILNSGEDWDVLRLPAISETQAERDSNDAFLGLPTGQADPLGRMPGESLAPRRFSITALKDIRKSIGSLHFSALYQGVPRAPEGTRFKREWFTGEGKIVGSAPRVAKRIRYWDKAGTQDGGKFTAGVLLAQANGLTYVEDVVRGQWSAGKREQIIKETAERDAMLYGGGHVVEIYIEQEPGSGGKESAENTIKNLSGYTIKADSPRGDKDLRLNPFEAQAEAGNIRIVRAPWNHEYVEEFIALPAGTYRDQSDATAGAFNKFNKPVTKAGTVGYSGLYKNRDKNRNPFN